MQGGVCGAMRCNITPRGGSFVIFYRIQWGCAWKVGKVGLLFILNKHDKGWIDEKENEYVLMV